MEKEYYILKPELRSAETRQENIETWLKVQETDFYQTQIAQERDYCFWCRIVETAKPHSLESYTSTAYTLTDPSTLNTSAKTNFILKEDETLYIHTLSVVRDGQVIDKLNDINVKVLDHIQEENEGNFDNEKNVTVLIRDLHLNDIFLIETTIERHYEKESMRNLFFRYQYTYPGPYWSYSDYYFEIKNETGQPIEGNYHYFRMESGTILEKEKIMLEDRNSFIIEESFFTGKEQKDLEVVPFIDFATHKTYPEITKTLANLYQRFYQVDLTSFAASFIEELDVLPSLEYKIKYAIDFVQKEIYYLYNEAEMDGHEPQAAAITFKSKQGDCKAKTVLLKVILDYLGMNSEIVLVNYREDIYLPVYTPSPFNFNHAILKIYGDNNQIYFIDATISNDQGFLDKRQRDSFMNYLEIKAGTDLQKQGPFQDELPAIEEIIHCDVRGDIANFILEGTMRGGVANSAREMFKNQAKIDIITRFNNSVYTNMLLYKTYEQNEIPNNFTNTSIEIIKDDKELNEIKVIYKTTISSPYEIEGNKRFLNYWDPYYFLNNDAENHRHKDFPIWINRNSVRMEIHLSCDNPIYQQETFTRDLTSTYLQHHVTKKVEKHGISCYLDYRTHRNLPLAGPELKEYIELNEKIRNSNWGVGIDLIEDGFFKKISRLFKSK